MYKRNSRVHGWKVGGCLSLLGLPQQTAWLKQGKSVRFWGIGLHGQGTGIIRLWWVFFSCPADGCLLAVSLLGGKRVRALYFSLENYLHPEGTTLMTSSKPDYLPKAPSPNIVTSRVRASIHDSWTNTFWSTTLCLPLKFMSFLGCKVHSFNPNSSQSPGSSTLKSNV